MAEGKKYYWLKLKRDFFKRHDIRIIEGMENGKDYILFYLKLLVESVDHSGNLRFSDTIPYNDKMLATLTDTNIDIVRSALKIFTELHMIEVLDDETIYMSQVNHMIGSETEWAEKKRKQRDKKNQITKKEENVLTMSSMCPPNVRQEIETDKDKDKDTEIELNKVNLKEDKSSLSVNGRGKAELYQEIVDHWNSLPSNITRISKISERGTRKNLLDARIKEYGIDQIHAAIEEIPKSEFLMGYGNRGWTIKFDWFIKPSNFVKVLEGNYRGKVRLPSGNAYIDAVNNRYDPIIEFAQEGEDE